MSKGSLKNRDRGFAPFEAQLINTPHTGWVHWISRDMFVLRKSPFTELQTPHAYKVPMDICPPENLFIEVEVKRNLINYNIIKKSVIRYYEVLSFKETNLGSLDIPKPYLYTKRDFIFSYLGVKDEFQEENEFVERIASYWKNADEDKLDWAIAIQMLSCPRSIYGIGGIGAESTSLAGSRKTPLLDIRRCINQLLPVDFRSKNNNLKYHFIEDKTTLLDVRMERNDGKTPEVSYNYLYYFPAGDVPIQLPIFIENAEYINKLKDNDPDIINFILTALTISPPIEDGMVQKIENSMIKVHEKLQLHQDLQLSIDLYSPVKIALALCRMNLKEKLDENILSKSLSQFAELYEKYVDAKDYLLKVNPERETRVIPHAGGSYKEPILSQETRIHKIIIGISEESGMEWVPLSLIHEHEKFNPKWSNSLGYSLQTLNNSGLVLMRKNYTEFKPLKYDQ